MEGRALSPFLLLPLRHRHIAGRLVILLQGTLEGRVCSNTAVLLVQTRADWSKPDASLYCPKVIHTYPVLVQHRKLIDGMRASASDVTFLVWDKSCPWRDFLFIWLGPLNANHFEAVLRTMSCFS